MQTAARQSDASISLGTLLAIAIGLNLAIAAPVKAGVVHENDRPSIRRISETFVQAIRDITDRSRAISSRTPAAEPDWIEATVQASAAAPMVSGGSLELGHWLLDLPPPAAV